MYDDYRNYVFARLGATIGEPCPNWKSQLEGLTRLTPPFGINPPPSYVQPLNAPHHAITIMIDGGGNARGRGWLPTDLPVYDGNGNAWFTHEIQFIDDGPNGGLVWAWLDKGGAPVRRFAPDAAEPVPPTPEPLPPTGDYVTKDECAQMIRTALVDYIKSESNISLKTQEWDGQPGKVVCADRNHDQTPLLANRDGVGNFETFTVKKV